MSNIIIGYNNLIDSATLSGGSWSIELPLTNLQNRFLSKKSRSSNALATSTLINIDLGSEKLIKAIGVIATNISVTGALYRIRGSNDNTFATRLYDSGTVSADTHTPDLIRGITAGIFGEPSEGITARYWRIEIFDTSNTSGYIQLGRIFIGDGFRPIFNYTYDSTMGYISTTKTVTSIGEVDFFDKRPVRRNTQLSFDMLNETESDLVFLLNKFVDINKELLLILDPSDIVHNQRTNFLCTLAQLNPLQNPYLNINKTTFNFKEIV